MSFILGKILKKKFGVNEFKDLNEEEKQTYREWENMLTERKLTDEDVKTFLDAELESVLDKLPKQIDGSRQDTFLKVKLEFIRSIQKFLFGPKLEVKAAEKMMSDFLNS